MKPSTDRKAIGLIIEGLIARGCTPTTARDGENDDLDFTDATREEFLDWLTSCDESVMFVDAPTGESGHVYFVLGNDPEEVACDHTVNLSEYIDPIIEPWWE